MGLLEHYGDISVLYLWGIGVKTTFQDFGGCVSFLRFQKQWSMRRIFRGKQINRLRLIACIMIILGVKMCRMFNMISGLSRCFIDFFFHSASRRWNLILCILELGSVAVSTPQTGNHMWSLNLLQTTKPTLSEKMRDFFSLIPSNLSRRNPLQSPRRCHFSLLLFFLNLQWSGYTTDEASLFLAQPFVAATVALNMSNGVSRVEQVWRSDAVELCCFQLFVFFFFFFFFQQKELLNPEAV